MKIPNAHSNQNKYLKSSSFILTLCLVFASLFSKSNAQQFSKPDEPIKIGVYTDLTGQTSSFGQSTRNGIQMAADEINARGGVNGRRVVLIIRDDEGQPSRVATVVQSLINEDKVHALLGELASINSLVAAPYAQESQVPMLSPSSTNPKVTQIGDYIFRTCFIDPLQGEAMAKFAVKSLKAKRAAILVDLDSIYGNWLMKPFKEKFSSLGGKIVTEQTYKQRDRDFREQLSAIRKAKPDVIYVPGYYQEAAVIAVQARQMDINQPLLGGDGWESPQLFYIGGQALNNSYITEHYAADDPSPAVQNFSALYKNRYPNSEPDAIAALAYDSMMVLADAIRRAGTTEGLKLRDAIAKTKDFPGVTGRITINSERNALKQVVILKISDGKLIFRENIQPDH